MHRPAISTDPRSGADEAKRPATLVTVDGIRPSSREETAVAPTPEHVNEVRLVGRLAAEPIARELPSGDRLVSFRLVVARTGPTGRRPPPGASVGRQPTVDTLDCAVWRQDVARTLSRAGAGDILEVHGALRRRFWRAAGGPASRSEVEVTRARRVAGAD